MQVDIASVLVTVLLTLVPIVVIVALVFYAISSVTRRDKFD
ncbi:MAG TPA: hypothetical protein VH593_27820 [Ktedonobacteraceae bacterium]